MSLPLIHIPTLHRYTRNDPNDVRMGEIISFVEHELPVIQPGDVCLIGFPEDRGVIRNYGREGASSAPDRVKEMFYRLPASNYQFGLRNFSGSTIFDFGNVDTGNSLAEAQTRLGNVVAWVLHRGGIPVLIGGGHETAYGHFLGYVETRKPVSVLNFDAHLDLREVLSDGIGTSGSPFRQMIQHPSGLLDRYGVSGIQPNANSVDYLDFAIANKVRFSWLSELNGHGFQTENLLLPEDESVYVTVDIDGFSVQHAPGCSAPQVIGFNPERMLPLLLDLGKNKKVTSLDICEVNPFFDRDNQTSKLAAMLIYNFITGLSLRS